jgi:hypothetical protein
MGHYGYRLFVVHARDGMKQRNLDFSDIGGHHFIDSLYQDLTAGTKKILKLEDPPKASDDGSEAQPTGSVVRYEAIDRKNWELRLDFHHGTFGEGGTLIDPDGINIDLDIEGRAVSKPYRALIQFPEKGAAAILAVEAHGRACPYKRVLASLKVIYSTSHRLFLASGVADRAAVAQFIRNGVVKELEVTTHGSSREGDPTRERVKLTVSIPGASRLQDSMRERALQWANAQWQRVTNHDARRDLANELAAAATGVTIPIDFEDSILRVDGPNNRSRSLRPSKEIGEWIYDIGDFRLNDEKWFDLVSRSVTELFPSIAATEGVIPPG